MIDLWRFSLRKHTGILSGKIRKLLPVVILASIIVALFGPSQVFAAGNTFFVAKNGANTNPGTETSPWLTIQYAVSKMSAGSSLLVKSGVYNELISIVSRPANMIIKAYPGNLPVIDGTNLSNGTTGLVTIRNTNYLTFDGFEIRNTTAKTGGYGLYAYQGVDHLTVRNIKIHNINKGGMYFAGLYTHAATISPTGSVTNLLVDNCEVYDTNRVLASNEQVSLIRVNGFEIRNSKFHDSGINGIDTDGKDGVDFKNGTSNGSLHDCELYGSRYTYGDAYSGTSWNGIYIDGQGSAQNNIKIYNNYFHDICRGAIVIGNESGTQAISNIDIFNNVFYNNQYALRIYPRNFTRNYRFINNTCYKNYYTINSQATTGVNSNCIIRNNVLYGTSPVDYLIYIANYSVTGKPTIDHNIYYNPAGYQSHLASLIGGYTPKNPLLMSVPGNYKLQSGSPAVDTALDSFAPIIDYLGIPRPQGKAKDIGAYEVSSASIPVPTPTPTPPPPTSTPTGTVVNNASFETDSDANGIPDGWTVNFSYLKTSGDRASSGLKSMLFSMVSTDTTHRRAYSSLMPISAGVTYTGSVDTYYSSLTTTASSYLMISYYTTTDGSGTQYLTSALVRVPGVVGSWKTTTFTWTPPSTARSFRILLYVGNAAKATLYWDNLKLTSTP